MSHATSPLIEKKRLRAEVLARRDALAPDTMQVAGKAIAQHLAAVSNFVEGCTLCSYMAIGSEAATDDIVRQALARGARLALPRTHLDERRLTLHQVTDLDHLVVGRYGIPEPAPDAPLVSPDEVDVFLVPGVAFDPLGNRLGHGAGFYDGLLAGRHGSTIALAYACQIVPCIPVEAHDVPVDLIVTESGVIDCRRARRCTDHLRLRNIQCYGHHGVFPEERDKGLRLAFDIDLRLDLQWPGLTDLLETTVNYPAVFRLVERVQRSRQFQLLEALVEHVATAILDECPPVCEVTVVARKFNPPVGGPLDAFEVEITRSRPGDALVRVPSPKQG